MSLTAMVACRSIKAGSYALKAVLMAMADVARDDGSNIYISTQTIADYTEFSVRAVRSNIDLLVKSGILEVSESRSGRTTIYRISPKIMDGTWHNPCTRCTPAPNAPLHQMQYTPAPDAPLPLHQMQDTPAPDAPEHKVNTIFNSIELNAGADAGARKETDFVAGHHLDIEAITAFCESNYPESSHTAPGDWKRIQAMIVNIPKPESLPGKCLAYRRHCEDQGLGPRFVRRALTWFRDGEYNSFYEIPVSHLAVVQMSNDDPVEGVDYQILPGGRKIKMTDSSPFDEAEWRASRAIRAS